MGEITRMRLAEYMVGHSIADEPTHVDRVELQFLEKVELADFLMQWNSFCNFEMVRSVKTIYRLHERGQPA